MARRGTIALISSQSPAAAHMMVMPIPAWGHIRPLCAFVARVVQMQPVYVTFLIAGDNVARVQAEIDQYFLAPEHHILLTLIRVVGLGPLVPLAVPHLFSMGSIAQTYQDMYKVMLRGHPIRCAWTGDLHSAFPPPTVLILDICSTFAIEVTQSVSRQSIPLLAWVATPASSLIRLFSDESRGGIGDLGSRIYERAAETGCRAEDVAGEVFRACDGSVVKIPGLPDHYDHEWFPQEPRSASRIPWVIHKGHRSLQACDGAISLTSEVYEPETTKAMHDWFSEEGKEFFGPGPLTVPIVGFPESPVSELSNGNDLSSQDLDAQTLLDAAFDKYGMHSLIYIAFGSVFWPKESDHVWELISILLDLQIPFIFSHATICGDIPDDITERVNESGIGLFLPWSPQQMILSHPATGWFLSHCGANSVLESLYQGVPLICWPQEGDQPANAAYVSTALNAGFELVQVRTGLGMRKLYRDGTVAAGTLEAVRAEFHDVLCQARGKSGEQKRMNAQKMGRKLADTWLDGGASQRTMARFVEKFLQ